MKEISEALVNVKDLKKQAKRGNKYDHKAFSRAKNRPPSKQAKGFREFVPFDRKPQDGLRQMRKLPREAPYYVAKEAVKNAKEGVLHGHRHAKGRNLSLEGGIRPLKAALRKERKIHVKLKKQATASMKAAAMTGASDGRQA